MKKYQKYSKELKQEIIKRYLAGESAKELVKEYNLSTVVLIYQWVNKQDTVKCDLDPSDKSSIENKYLKEQLKVKEKELALINKQLQTEQLRGEFLKKHIPFDKKLCQREREEILNSKDFKIKAFEYIEEYQSVYSVKFMCEFLPVTRQSYYKWIKANKIRISKVDYEKDELIAKAICKFYDKFKMASGNRNIKLFVENELNFKVGIHKIRKLNAEIVGNINWKTNKNIGRNENVDKHENQIRPDYIKDDYSTTAKFQKLGIDGTWLSECTVNNAKCKLMFEIAYDLHDGSVVAHRPDFTENKYVVSEVILDIIKKVNEHNQTVYIQTDRGRANTSKLVKLIEDNNSSIKLSMSDSGFKHNAPTEALNGWIKEKFYHTYGKKFKSYDELIEKFNKYIINWNNLKMYLQTNNPVVVQPQDYRNQSVNLAC